MREYRDGLFQRTAELRLFLAVAIIMVIITSYICIADFDVYADDGAELVILMYHNVIPDSAKESKYEITVSSLERDMKYLKEKGYTAIDGKDLIAYAEGGADLPKKCVMLTFDDGYYSYLEYLPLLLDRYGMKAVVNVVGEYTRLNKNNPNVSKRYTYLDFDDIKVLASSGRIEIGLHSYMFHHINKSRQGVKRNAGESAEEYKKVLTDDTSRLVSGLSTVGVKSYCYAYPYGLYSKESDGILRSLGVKYTLTCNEGVNRLKRDKDLLYGLKRYNRDGRWSGLDGLKEIK